MPGIRMKTVKSYADHRRDAGKATQEVISMQGKISSAAFPRAGDDCTAGGDIAGRTLFAVDGKDGRDG
jgi:hypothetical protein